MSNDREMDHLEMMSGMVDRHWNQPYCYAEVEELDREEFSATDQLHLEKCSIVGPCERVEQLVKSAAASYYHTNLVAQIQERIGDGDPMHLLLRDSYYRKQFNMKARQW